MDDICGLLVASLKAEFDKGIENVNSQEVGDVIDMIKDISECKKNCAMAEYYQTVVDSMKAGSDETVPYTNTLNMIREVWKDADPELRKHIKEDFTKLVSEMT